MTILPNRLAALRADRSQTLNVLGGLTEAQLALPVPWRGRQADVRYLLLRLAEADDERRVALESTLEALGWRQSEAARILGGRVGHVRSLLVGLPDGLLNQKPAPGEWSVGQTLEHMRITEERYLIQTEYAVERLAAPDLPIRVPDDRLPSLASEPASATTVAEALAGLEAIGDAVDSRLIGLAADAYMATTIWAGWTVDVRFRLHRFRAHARQHAVQIAKALQVVGWQPTEAQMILGHAEEARAALEGVLLGCPDGLLDRAPAGLPSISALLDQALANEEDARAIVLDSS